MACRPGDLVLIPFPYSDLQSSKKRSVLVLTAPDRHGDFIALAVTSVPPPDHAMALDASVLAAWCVAEEQLGAARQGLHAGRRQYRQDLR